MTAPRTITYSTAVTTVTVPADASVARVECWGAGQSTAKGGYAKGDVAVSPGDILYVHTYSAADVRLGSDVLGARRIIAGAAGDSGLSYNGTNGTYTQPAGYDGGGLTGAVQLGGTQTAGGQGDIGTSPGYAGQLGSGGNGGVYGASHGGKGGDGYYGGGGGSANAVSDYSGNSGTGNGGGGGSGFVGDLANSVMSTGVWAGTAQVVITWVNTAPLAPTPLTPATGVSVLVPPTIRWSFGDPDTGDSQTSADVQFRLAGAPSWTTVTAAASTVSAYTFSGGAITTGSSWEWQVRTKDKTGAVSPWSASFFFNAVAVPPVPTITAPAAGATLMNTPTTVTWTVPVGQTQTAYQVRRCSDSVGTIVYFDTGQTTSAALSATVPLDMVFGRTDHFQVRYFAGVWSTWADVSAITYAGPPQPALVVCTPNPAAASVSVAITNPPQASGFASAVSNDITRTSPDGSTVRIVKGLTPNATFVDRLPGAGSNTYRVTAYASNGSTSTSP